MKIIIEGKQEEISRFVVGLQNARPVSAEPFPIDGRVVAEAIHGNGEAGRPSIDEETRFSSVPV